MLKYGEAAPKPGCWVMDAPAYASESLTGFTAAGAQLMLFTTGVGNSFVSAPAPTITAFTCFNAMSYYFASGSS